jgi:accessory gene regulator protein AgrB
MTTVMCITGIKIAELTFMSFTNLAVMSIASLTLILKLSPKDTSHKKIKKDKKRMNKKRSILVCVTLSSVSLFLYAFSSINKLYPALIIIGLFLEALSLMLKTN